MLRTGLSLFPEEDNIFGNHTIKFFRWPTDRMKWFLQWGGRYFNASIIHISLLPGYGWYSLEGDSNNQQRWTKKEASVYFQNHDVTNISSKWLLDLRFINSPKITQNKLSIFINNNLLATSKISLDGQDVILRIHFSAETLLPKWNKLTLKTQKTFIPSGPDNRNLGLLVKRIRITPEK